MRYLADGVSILVNMDNDSCLEVIKVDGWQVDIFSQQKIIVKLYVAWLIVVMGRVCPPEERFQEVCRKRSFYLAVSLAFGVR